MDAKKLAAALIGMTCDNCSEPCQSCSARNNGWIPVSERLPEANVGVLVSVTEEERRIECLAFIVADDRQTIDRPNSGPWRCLWIDQRAQRLHVFDFSGEVTHWQPLPEPPKE